MKTIYLLSTAFTTFTVCVRSVPVAPFQWESNPVIHQVPNRPTETRDDRNLPKGVPIPVKFYPGYTEPHVLLTQVTHDDQGRPKSKLKPPEFPRGKGKPGEESWQTAYRELYEEAVHTGKVDHEHVMHEWDGRDLLAAHIITVPAHQEPGRNLETARRNNMWIPASQVLSVMERKAHRNLFEKAYARMYNAS